MSEVKNSLMKLMTDKTLQKKRSVNLKTYNRTPPDQLQEEKRKEKKMNKALK